MLLFSLLWNAKPPDLDKKYNKKQSLGRENDVEFNDTTSEMLFAILRMKRYFIDALREIPRWLR